MRAKMMIRILLTLAFTVAAVQAHALTIIPQAADNLTVWTGDVNNTSVIALEIADIMGIDIGDLDPLYKAEASATVVEEGDFLGSYETVFGPDPLDPGDATIEYVSGDIINSLTTYLLIKDGNHSPAWYLYDISGWDGTEIVEIEGFWPAFGAISHVAIYGVDAAPVPEPATMLLFGTGLAGLAGSRLRKKKK